MSRPDEGAPAAEEETVEVSAEELAQLQARAPAAVEAAINRPAVLPRFLRVEEVPPRPRPPRPVRR